MPIANSEEHKIKKVLLSYSNSAYLRMGFGLKKKKKITTTRIGIRLYQKGGHKIKKVLLSYSNLFHMRMRALWTYEAERPQELKSAFSYAKRQIMGAEYRKCSSKSRGRKPQQLQLAVNQETRMYSCIRQSCIMEWGDMIGYRLPKP